MSFAVNIWTLKVKTSQLFMKIIIAYGTTILASRTLRTTLVAPCPLCSNERDDKRPKTLYAIFGFQNGQFDKDIPNVWFDVPPLKLDSSGLGMEALRVSLQLIIKHWS